MGQGQAGVRHLINESPILRLIAVIFENPKPAEGEGHQFNCGVVYKRTTHIKIH